MKAGGERKQNSEVEKVERIRRTEMNCREERQSVKKGDEKRGRGRARGRKEGGVKEENPRGEKIHGSDA